MKPPSKIFKNPSYEQQFERDGVLRVPFLTAEAAAGLRAAGEERLSALKQAHGNAYHVTLLSDDAAYRESVKALLRPRFDAWQQEVLAGFTTITNNLIVKFARSGEVPIHQNWTFVDESRACSLTLWCPLQDTDEQNGTLFFLKGSHRTFRDVRRGPQTPYFFLGYQEAIRPLFEPFPLKAGEAVLFDDAILHYSPVNRTDRDRLAIQGNFVPRSETIYYHEFKKGWLRDKIFRYPIRDIGQLERADWAAIREASETPETFSAPSITLKEFQERLKV